MLARLAVAAALAAAVFGTAWAQAPTGPAAAAAAAAAAPGPAGAGALGAGPADYEYRLGSGDKIRIIVFNEPTLSGEFFVGGNGKVSLPLIGEVQAAGLTLQAFQGEVQDQFRKGYLKEPRVSAEVLTYRPFYILGEVNKPGEYPYSNGLNVLNAVATAGGFTYRAQTKKVYIRHLNDTQEQSYALTSETPVEPGDTIRIGERFF